MAHRHFYGVGEQPHQAKVQTAGLCRLMKWWWKASKRVGPVLLTHCILRLLLAAAGPRQLSQWEIALREGQSSTAALVLPYRFTAVIQHSAQPNTAWPTLDHVNFHMACQPFGCSTATTAHDQVGLKASWLVPYENLPPPPPFSPMPGSDDWSWASCRAEILIASSLWTYYG